MSTVREHLGLLWLMRNRLATTNPQYDHAWADQASQFTGVHLDDLITLAGGADVEGWAGEHFPEIPATFPLAPLPAAPAPTEQAAQELTATELVSHELANLADNEAAAKAIYRLFDGAGAHPWIDGGNSTKQDDARRYARAALAARQTPTEAAGQWVRCSPSLINAGVNCGNTPRRGGDGTYSHDHFIAHGIARQVGAPDAERDTAKDPQVIPGHLREFVEAMAHRFDTIDRETDDEFCKGCSGLAVWDEDTRQSITHHRPDCIVLRAETILAQEKAS